MRRVVVSGMGAVTPLGGDLESTWKNLIANKSGANFISKFDTTDFQTKISCEVPIKNDDELLDESFDPGDWFSSKDLRKVDDFIIFGVAAAEMAIKDSLLTNSNYNPSRIGVGVGSGVGGLPSIEQASLTLAEKGPKRVSPFFIPGALINLVSGQISIRNNFKGPNLASVTACSSGTHSICEGAEMIRRGKADVMIVGGAESAICPVGMQQRASIARALAFDANILLMDEPFGALDEIVRDRLNSELLDLWRQTKKTICFVTHSIPEAVFLSTKIVVMSPRPGRITDIIESTLPSKRDLNIRDSQEFIKIAQRVREGLKSGHQDEIL